MPASVARPARAVVPQRLGQLPCSPTPVLRPLSFVHDSHDQHVITAHLVDHAIRESAKRSLPQVIDEDRPAFRRLRDLLHRPLQGHVKAARDVRGILINQIPTPGGLRLARSCRMPPELNHPLR